ncbi:unnamed protein product [Rhizoctonia solani]|uniref:Homeobox domain-containing protein n=1 Tax=Rhizoctonia solani TaxID=456999 RepID=A0A8H3E8S2_9AGAM|nr:unnamed protein product [Rhizoctonia solani]
MSNRPSPSPPPDSPPSSPPFAYTHPIESFVSTPMIHVGRPTPIAPPNFSALHSHYTPRSSHPIVHPTITSSRLQTTTAHNRPTTPPEPMRASEHDRGLKRARSEDVEEEEEERQSLSGSEASEHAEQTIMPAPKKRTRTLMTPDQLTALHRLLSQTRFPTTEQREQCGREIGLSARRVQVWFQNQRQKSKAQQQASSTAGGSRQAMAPQSAGPYRVFNYSPSYYDPHPRPYTSPHSYTYGPSEPSHHPVDTSPLLRRSQRLGYHRRGNSSQSYYAPHERSYEYRTGTYPPPPPYTLHEPEYTRSPAPYHRDRRDSHYHSPPRARSPIQPGSVPREDATLPPIWPENERPREEPSAARSPSFSTHPAPSRRPSLLPTGLPPPQPLEPTPIWNHPHTNPRYMRPLPPAAGLPSLLTGLGGRARSDPPLTSTQSSASARSDRGLGLELFGVRPTVNPETREDAPTSPEQTHSAPVALDSERSLPAESSPKADKPETEPARPQTSRGLTNSRRSSLNEGRD